MTLPSGFFTLLGAVIAGGLLFWAILGKKKASDKSEEGSPGTVINGAEDDD